MLALLEKLKMKSVSYAKNDMKTGKVFVLGVSMLRFLSLTKVSTLIRLVKKGIFSILSKNSCLLMGLLSPDRKSLLLLRSKIVLNESLPD